MSDTRFDEGRQIFVEESRDLIRSMEEALLTLEGQPDDAEAMNALFRAAHTIKGSAGLFPFNGIVSFTHVLENVLDRVRAGQQVLEPELMELALRCSDHVGALLDVVTATGNDGAVDPAVASVGESLLAALNQYLGDTAAVVHAVPDGIWEDAAPARSAVAGPVTARETWHVSLRFGVNVLRIGMDPLSFLRYLGTIGQVERVLTVDDHLPEAASFDPESCYLGVELLLRTTADEKTILDAFEFVREDCQLHVLPPHAPLANYVDLLAALPESTERTSALMLEVGALAAAELEAVLAWPSPDTAAAAPPSPAEAPDAKSPNGSAQRTQARAGEAGRFIRVPADKLDRLITLVGELVIAGSASSSLARARADIPLREAAATVDGLVEEIRGEALRLRMVQVGDTFHRFDRVVRDVSRELGKEIALVISGGETELDKSMVDQINDPLTHLVRNAIDHGIEDRETRLAAGKLARGEVRLHAYHDSGSVVIEVSDDGRGLDRAKLLKKGRERGLVAPDETPTDQEIMSLIFEPGFSTAAKVTNLSGRGVGMDVVRRNIHELRGSVSLASVPGQGTTVIIRLPLTLAIIDGFLVQVNANSYVIPLNNVFECIELPTEYRDRPIGGDFINLRGQVLPLLRLRDAFKLGGSFSGRQNVVVLNNGGQRAGLVVDQLLGERQTVIKPLGKLFAAVPGIGGSTVLGSGEVALILDVPSLIQRARHGGPKRYVRASTGPATSIETNAKGITNGLVS
jgi:two-component system, chemotaxis family, sensor kinase CheA